MRRAFTLVETLSVMVILGVLSSFLFPVFMQAVRSAHVTSQLGKLRQLHVAFSLYRIDYDGDGKYGTSSEMGLPSNTQLLGGAYKAVSAEADLWHSACGVHPEMETYKQPIDYIYPPCEHEIGCGEYYRKHAEDSVLIIDPNCNEHDTPFQSPYRRKLVVGVRLNGQAKSLVTYSDPGLVDNWHTNP
jgi:prepilin-type N-terminal cleavage/methylation domain-containing protein